MDFLAKVIKQSNKVLVFVSVIALLVMVMVSVINITGRKLFNVPLTATMELVEFLAVIFVALGLAFTQATKSNIIMTILTEHFKPRVQRILGIITLILCVLMVMALVWAGTVFAWGKYTDAEISPILSLPTAVFRFIWVFGCIFLFLALTQDFIEIIRIKKGTK
jgi:TRAP-type C4-dicarboxylate transport system permease small subunit